ncbi:MAG: chemotaxis protein CheR [Alphaproteobacteria bacterium]|nr:chemotaxis protein CheR [Alphaproteobacteria bacterium]
MTPATYTALSDWLYARLGLSLGHDKAYLVESRIGPVLRRHGIAGMDTLGAMLPRRLPEDVAREICGAMAANESAFFRDVRPYAHFARVALPALLRARAGARRLRIWDAAAGGGQQAYSVAMLLHEAGAALEGWSVEIVATDIGEEVLRRSREGIYTHFEIQRGLPARLMVRHFQRQGDRWQASPELRAAIRFGAFNLMHDPRPLGVFDAVFCRYALAQLEAATRDAISARIAQILTADGFLYLGEGEVARAGLFAPVAGEKGVFVHAPRGPGAVAPSLRP